MKKLLLALLILPVFMQAQTPDADSLKRFNDRYMKSVINAFSYNRLHTLLNNMLSLSPGGGGSGTDGREVTFRVNGGFIQWQYVGAIPWTNLIATSTLTGAPGSDATATTDASALVTGTLNNARLVNVPLSTLAQSGASNGSVIKWNGSAWAIGTDNTGGGGGAVNSVNSQTGDVVLNQDNVADGSTAKQYTATEKTKLSGIATGASNDRANHTGSQSQSTITNLTSDLGLKANIASPTFTGTVSGITATMVGLGSVSNTSDASKPVSTAQATAIGLKVNISDTATFRGADRTALNNRIDTLRNSIYDSLAVVTTVPIDAVPTNGSNNPVTSDGVFDALAAKGDVTIAGSQTLTNKSISGATNTLTAIPQSAVTNLTSDLALKASLASPALTGTPTAPTATGGTNTTQIATTQFVTSAVAAATTGVSSFNGRTGAVVPVANDYATLTETYTNKTLTAPVLGGTVTGTYTIGGTPTFPSSVAQLTTTQTLTNKRWTARVGTTTSSATPTINTDNVDIYKLTAQAADITSFTTNLTGTPVDGDVLEIQITGTAARAISFGSSFVASTIALPTTTVTTAALTVVFQYFSTSSYGTNKWVLANTF